MSAVELQSQISEVAEAQNLALVFAQQLDQKLQQLEEKLDQELKLIAQSREDL